MTDKKIEPAEGYPIWMKSPEGKFSLQTSGLFYLGRQGQKKFFLSANDNGRIDRISLDESFSPPKFDGQVLHFEVASTAKFFAELAKMDFEDIVYDKVTNRILVSIEGNSDFVPPRRVSYQKTEGLYELEFNKTILDCDTLKKVKKIPLPEELFLYTNDNVTFEGFAITDNHIYLGLENITDVNSQFSDSTYLYIMDRNTRAIKKISSKLFNVRSITGLCAKDDFTLYGVDRESKKLFYVKFNPDFSIKEHKEKPFDLPMPGHPDFSMDKMTGVEAIAVDDEGNIYTDVDPWSDLYKPDLTPKALLSEEEKINITKLIPVLYKYKNPFQ
ncbi:MAG: hypothetical protein K1X86_13960 [Ignavibacteria bacterium]|nr:hypothetical protein [Ignavibacteria bacterium]